MSEREEAFQAILSKRVVDIEELREASWFGVPPQHRPLVWLILLNIIDYNTEDHHLQIEKKVERYLQSIARISNESSPVLFGDSIDLEDKDRRQIERDVRRDGGANEQGMYFRAMALTSRRRAAVGYVQGMCDIYGVFLEVFMETHPEKQAEALSYFCFSRVIDQVQENFVENQEGLVKGIERVEHMLRREDAEVYNHIVGVGVQVKDFCSKWLSTFFVREFKDTFIKTVMDAQFSLGIGSFLSFNEALCVAVVLVLKKEILRLTEFEEVITLLLNLSTSTKWEEEKIRRILSMAYVMIKRR